MCKTNLCRGLEIAARRRGGSPLPWGRGAANPKRWTIFQFRTLSKAFPCACFQANPGDQSPDCPTGSASTPFSPARPSPNQQTSSTTCTRLTQTGTGCSLTSGWEQKSNFNLVTRLPESDSQVTQVGIGVRGGGREGYMHDRSVLEGDNRCLQKWELARSHFGRTEVTDPTVQWGP